ncbi:DUF3800 domain-containing protein [Sphingomonas sanxanigenens]|uniref:DUF3800 domain-containing protein n=1 Tax=Sphingomonas sanxanigenens DSM 19645 = NX02 TaxID=1123269 RepID=W0A6W3_9SPHN|nr:DUF3800 domain-containing protein [Sphingomonas sanxanigenens]AHE52831.1 hypothetical protein NX02_05460 [Sphingomonas sanxanigenens DSM 19645 = NX02]
MQWDEEDWRTPRTQEEISEIYIDESSQTKNRFLLLGGVIIPKRQLAAAEARIAEARLPELPFGEMKWGKVSRSKLAAYKRVADAFFDAAEFKRCHFHSLVVDTALLDHVRYNAGSKEIGFNKEIYQLATKFAKLYPTAIFHLYPDYRNTSQRPDDLRDILNHGRRKDQDSRDWPFRRCQFRDSAKTPLLQLVDILLGSVAFGKNQHFAQPDASPHKLELARHVMRKAGIKHLDRDTARTGKFTIWNRQLRQRGVPRD